MWVAAAGHLYGPNAERGVFMTTDGGKTWNKTLFVSDDTGATELIIDPSNPMNLWAAMYERQRTAWGFVGGGPGSGIYQSTDGGKTWKKVTGNGLPRGTMGRIALDICKTAAERDLRADRSGAGQGNRRGARSCRRRDGRGARGQRRGGAAAAAAAAAVAADAAAAVRRRPIPQGNGVWKSIDKGKTWTFMSNENQRPMYFSQIRVDPNNPNTVYVGGVNPQKSDRRRQDVRADSRHGPRRQPRDLDRSERHAGHRQQARDVRQRRRHRRLVGRGRDVGIDSRCGRVGALVPRVGRHAASVLGVHRTAGQRLVVRSELRRGRGGIHLWNWISVGGGDGFQSQIDPTDPNIFYTESQNAGIQRYDLNTASRRASSRPCPSRRCGGGGGGGRAGGGGAVAVVVDARARRRRGAAAVRGGWRRRRGGCRGGGAAGGGASRRSGGGGRGGRGNVINTPPPSRTSSRSSTGTRRFGSRRTTPARSCVGGRQLFISRDRGETWIMTRLARQGHRSQSAADPRAVRTALPGLRRGGGAARQALHPLAGTTATSPTSSASITEMAESPVLPGVLWVGTDDGNVQVSKDGGNTWTEVGKNIPGVNHEYYVSGLEASWFDAGTAYVALDGHRNDDLKPYIFKTTDYGQTWTVGAGNLPACGNVNSIRQDPVNRNLLYAPTEFGFYISLDDGGSWHRFMPNLPTGRDRRSARASARSRPDSRDALARHLDHGRHLARCRAA